MTTSKVAAGVKQVQEDYVNGVPTRLVDSDGTAFGTSNPMPVQGSTVYATDVTVHDPNTVANKLAVDALGKVTVTEARSMTTGQATTGTAGAAAQIVAADSGRAFVRVRNTSAHTVYIGTSNGVVTTTGHAIPAGLDDTFPTQGALWVVSAQASDVVTYAAFTA